MIRGSRFLWRILALRNHTSSEVAFSPTLSSEPLGNPAMVFSFFS